MKKIYIFLLYMLIFPCLCLSQDSNCKMSLKVTRLSHNEFVCDISLLAHSGWKFAKAPSIFVSKKDIFESFVEPAKKTNDMSYDIRLRIIINDFLGNKKNSLQIRLDCFICKDICSIASKEIDLHFDCSQKIGETIVFSDNCDFNVMSTSSKNQVPGHTFFYILVFSIIGGLILNVMPCVLPVLLLKLRTFAEADKKIAIFGSIAGNYATFAIFAISVIFLKMCGESVGWGMHFQNISFLKFAAIALFLFSLYSFEIIKFTPALELREKQRDTFFKNFFSSMIAAIIAIPCTAPFLGTAATFAMQGSTLDLFSVFTAIATGFSIPYFAAIFTTALNIPKKMSTYSGSAKKIINSGIFIVFSWIIFLLFKQISASICVMYVAIFCTSFFLFVRQIPVPAFLLLLSIFVLDAMNIRNDAINMKKNNGVWIVSEDMNDITNIISKALCDNRIVILNISADWCLTCKYNKIRLLDCQQISNLIKDKKILCIEGDMTRASSGVNEIMEFIKKHNRVGIPFIMVYGPHAKSGILLSEIPSIVDLVNTINKADGNF